MKTGPPRFHPLVDCYSAVARGTWSPPAAPILTCHFVYKQSSRALLTDSTGLLFLVSEVLGEVESGEGVNAVPEYLFEPKRRGCGRRWRTI